MPQGVHVDMLDLTAFGNGCDTLLKAAWVDDGSFLGGEL